MHITRYCAILKFTLKVLLNMAAQGIIEHLINSAMPNNIFILSFLTHSGFWDGIYGSTEFYTQVILCCKVV